MATLLLTRSCLFGLFAVCPILFFTDLTRNPYYTQIALLNVLVCLCWLGWLVEAWRKGTFVWHRTALDAPLLAFMAVALLSWIWSWVRHPALRTPIYSEGSRAYVFLIVNTFLVYAAAVRGQTPKLFVWFLRVTYVVILAASTYGVAQYFGTEWIWPRVLNPYGTRPVSTFGNPNFLSSFLVVALPVVFVDLVARVTGTWRLLLVPTFIAACSALLATLTRSSWAGAFVGIAIVLAVEARRWWSKKPTRFWLLAALSTTLLIPALWPKGAAGAYSATVAGRLGEIASLKSGTYAPVSQRLLIWISAWTMVKEHPVLGKGWGCFELFYPFYQGIYLPQKAFQTLRTHANNCHNEFLEYWSQTGTVGLGLMILFWVTFFRLGVSIARRAPEDRRLLAWGLMAGVAGMLVDNLLNVSAHFAVPAFLLWWWVGSIVVCDAGGAVTPITVSTTTIRAKVAIAVAGVLLIGFAGRAYAMWRGEIAFFDGFKLSKAGYDLAGAQRHLEEAYDWHHLEVNNNYELANVYARTGQVDKALAMYERALDANAGYDEIYFNQATVLAQAGRTAEAIEKYRRAIAINPLSHDAYNALGNLLMKDFSANVPALEALYDRAVAVFPGDKDLWNNRGYVYAQQNKWDKAYEAYRGTVQADPEFEVGWRNFMTAAAHASGAKNDPIARQAEIYRDVDRLLQQHRPKEGLERLAPLAAALPRSYRAKFYEGNLHFAMEHFAEAAACYEQAAAARPDVTGVWQNLGVTYDRLGKKAEADAAFEKLLKLEPNNAAVRHRLGR